MISLGFDVFLGSKEVQIKSSKTKKLLASAIEIIRASSLFYPQCFHIVLVFILWRTSGGFKNFANGEKSVRMAVFQTFVVNFL